MYRVLLEGIAQNSSGSVFVDKEKGDGKPEFSGSPTEKAALMWGLSLGMDFDKIRAAKAIATECGILKEGDVALEGATFHGYDHNKRTEILSKLSVMARPTPQDKLILVRTLKDMGNVVAVTGDGTNDAPALHEADIGLSMGISGTEVAKESSDIIILDDNFETVVKVLRWGRSVYFNIQKFIQFQLTVNIAALIINFVAAVSAGEVPLTAVQLLWVNLIMDTLGALALATEKPSDHLMKRPPAGRKAPIVSNFMWRNLAAQALYQVAILLTLQFKGKQILGLKGPDSTLVRNTVIFNAFVLCQLFNEVNSRQPERLNIFVGIHRSPVFLTIVVVTLGLQFVIVQLLGRFASTKPLSLKLWLICFGIAFLSWPIAFIVKFIPVPEKPFINMSGFRKHHKDSSAAEEEDVTPNGEKASSHHQASPPRGPPVEESNV